VTPVRDQFLLHATSAGGLSILTGPMGLPDAMRVVDEHLLPHGWQHRYRSLTPPDEAISHFTAARRRPRPIDEADLFVALRRAITCDRHLDGIDDPRVQHLIAHIDPHRPLQLWTGDEECLLGECRLGEDRHATNADGVCEGLEKAARVCVACTAIYDSGSEYGPSFDLEVAWPCSVIAAATRRYLPAQVTRE
jgi:hypothetical protein